MGWAALLYGGKKIFISDNRGAFTPLFGKTARPKKSDRAVSGTSFAGD
jgi:hypothetical protein